MIPQDNASRAKALNQLGASTIADAQNGIGHVDIKLRRLSGRGTVSGRAITVRCLDGSSRGVGRALTNAKPGDVLFITAAFQTACLGDLVTAEIERRGIAAVILDGAARDIASLARSPVSFFVRDTNPIALKTQNPGEIDTIIKIGNTQIAPGDWIVADDDGVMVVRDEDLSHIIDKANQIAARENRILARICTGTPIADAFAAES